MELFDIEANYKNEKNEQTYHALHTRMNMSQFFTDLEQKARADMKNGEDIVITLNISKRDGDAWQSIQSN